MRALIFALVFVGCAQGPLPTPVITVAQSQKVYTIIAECGGAACPWTATPNATPDDVYVTDMLAKARAHFTADAQAIANTSPTLACDIVGLAHRFASMWISEMSDVDIECRSQDSGDFHLLAYATLLSD